MDEGEISRLIQACKLLKNNICGVFAADIFPLKLLQNRFIIVNVSSSDSIGTHWTLLCRKAITQCLYNRLASTALAIQNVYELLRNNLIQKQNSILCGLFCIYVAHYFYSKTEIVKMSDVDLIRFALHMMF